MEMNHLKHYLELKKIKADLENARSFENCSGRFLHYSGYHAGLVVDLMDFFKSQLSEEERGKL